MGAGLNSQDAKADAGKLQLTLVPKQIIYNIAEVREYGCNKYPNGGRDNWKAVEPQRYWDACVRHIVAAMDDYTRRDDESGLLHLSHAATNLAFLLEMMKEDGDDNSN